MEDSFEPVAFDGIIWQIVYLRLQKVCRLLATAQLLCCEMIVNGNPGFLFGGGLAPTTLLLRLP